MILLIVEKAISYLENEMEKRGWRQADLSRASGVDSGSLAMGWTFFRCNCSWDTPICRS